jgi:hypothetical protein
MVRSRGHANVHEIEAHGTSDLVIVDGLDRGKSALVASERLSESGVLVWDNSDRSDFRETIDELETMGFRRLTFSGLATITFVGSETTFLYRSGANCLGI